MSEQSRVAIVTGSSSGIGQAIAVELAAAGMDIIVNFYSDEAGAQETKRQVEAHGQRAVVVEADVSKVEEIKKLIAAAVDSFDRLDVMVNNAGMGTLTSLLETTEKQYDQVLDINLKGAFFGAQLAAEQFLKQEPIRGVRGRIINISSTHETWPMPGNIAYCCSKGGMSMLTRTAGVELAEKGILVVGVGPGAINTAMNNDTLENQEKTRKLEQSIPLGRIAEPEEVAALVAWLASDQNRYTTATTFMIDGGLMQAGTTL